MPAVCRVKRAFAGGKYQEGFRGNRFPRPSGYKSGKYDRPRKGGDFPQGEHRGNECGLREAAAEESRRSGEPHPCRPIEEQSPYTEPEHKPRQQPTSPPASCPTGPGTEKMAGLSPGACARFLLETGRRDNSEDVSMLHGKGVPRRPAQQRDGQRPDANLRTQLRETS